MPITVFCKPRSRATARPTEKTGKNYETDQTAGALFPAFQECLSLYASPDLNADETFQIMTIHKAKGLEFDTVILPGLGRISRNQDKHLLKWLEQPYSNEEDGVESMSLDLLLAPIQGAETNDNSIYAWIEKFEKCREDYELKRLLYLAATRARKFLHLLGSVNVVGVNGEKLLQSPKTDHYYNAYGQL